MRLSMILFLLSSVFFFGCSAKQLTPQGNTVVASYQQPVGNCKELGIVTGGQDNFWSGDFTSNHEMVQGGINEVRNRAAEMGGTHVVIQRTDTAQNIMMTAVTVVGTVYQCESN